MKCSLIIHDEMLPYCIINGKGSDGPQYWSNSALVLALYGINSSRSSDTYMCQRTISLLVQVNHYLNQCWLIVS